MLAFNDTVTLCHQPTGMKYSDASKAYAEFVTTGNYTFPSPPDELPGATSAPTTPIDGDAQTSTNQSPVASTSATALSPDSAAPAQPIKAQKARPKMKKARAITPIDGEAQESIDPDSPALAQQPKSRKAPPKMKTARARQSRGGSDSEDQAEEVEIPSDSEGEEDVDYEKLDTGADSDGLSNDGEQSDTGINGDYDEWDDEAPAQPGMYLFKYYYALAYG